MARGASAAGGGGTESYDDLLAVAHRLADVSAEAILRQFRKRLTVENKAGKGSFDPVTAADRAAERAIRKHLKEALPAHGIVGEEYGTIAGDGRHSWVIDPIDGTRGFITGLPTWGTLVGLLDNGEPLLGLMNQPYVRERFWSARKASYMRDPEGNVSRIKSRACGRIGDAILSATSPELFSRADAEAYNRVRSAVRSVRFGADCYAYCMVAAGHIDLVVECGLQPYDVVALIPLIERAGGVMTTWDGKPATDGGRIVAAGDPRLHAQALRLLSR